MNGSENVPAILANAHRVYIAHTTQVSAITRSLGITCLGTVWLLAGGLNSNVSPTEVVSAISSSQFLRWSFLLSLLGLLLDGLQYVWGSAMWGLYGWCLNRIWAVSEGEFNKAAVSSAWRLGSFFGVDRHFINSLLSNDDQRGEANSRSSRERKSTAQTLMAACTDPALRAKALDRPRSPRFINSGTLTFYWFKIIATFAAYGLLAAYVLQLV